MSEIMDDNYYQHIRHDLIHGISKGSNRILEVGCAEGATGLALKQSGQALEVVGIELVAEAARVAESRLDHVIHGDLESMSLDEPFLAPESFDYIICGDVLEHLKDPWSQLDRLLKLLKPGGAFICSLPNVRYYNVSFPLVFGDDWTYTNAGILDSTHLRFFTRSTGLRMLESAGLSNLLCTPLIHKRRDKVLKKGSFGLLSGLVTPQWILKGIKPIV